MRNVLSPVNLLLLLGGKALSMACRCLCYLSLLLSGSWFHFPFHYLRTSLPIVLNAVFVYSKRAYL
eukprot:bmy_08252T0